MGILFDKRKVKNALIARNILMAASAVSMVINTYAAENAFKDLIDNLKTVYSDIIPVILVIAALALVICAGIYLLSKNERRADEAFQWGKRILIGVAVVAIAPWLIQTVINALGDNMTGTELDLNVD